MAQIMTQECPFDVSVNCDGHSLPSRSFQQKSFSGQDLIHCRMDREIGPECQQMLDSKSKKFYYAANLIYNRYRSDSDHAVNWYTPPGPILSGMEEGATNRELVDADFGIDLRCHHSWYMNPYHRHADCLSLIVPTISNFFTALAVAHPELKRLPKRAPRNAMSPSADIVLIVDDASKRLCESFNKSTRLASSSSSSSGPSGQDVNTSSAVSEVDRDKCFYADMLPIISQPFHSTSIRCIERNIYPGFINWFHEAPPLVLRVAEMIYINRPYSSKTTQYSHFVRQYKAMSYIASCRYCNDKHALRSRHGGKRGDEHGVGGHVSSGSVVQDSVLILKRDEGKGRNLLQHDALVAAVSSVVRPRGFNVSEFTGMESVCDTVRLFRRAKVIIAAHGAGMVNVLYSLGQFQTLVIEITPNEMRGGRHRWRTNLDFIKSLSVNTRMLVVPHNTSAKAQVDLQLSMAISLRPDHIAKVANWTEEFLTSKSFAKTAENAMI